MLILDIVNQVSLSQALISVKNAVLVRIRLTGTLHNVKAVFQMLYVMVAQILRCHLNIGEGPQIQLRSLSD